MYHLVDNLTNKAGDALVGYFVKLRNSGGAYASIYSDANSTPISSVSGVANTAVSDSNGVYDLWVEEGSYDIDVFDKSDPTLLVSRTLSIALFSEASVLSLQTQIDSLDTSLTNYAAQLDTNATGILSAKSSNLNLFDPADVTSGYECYGDGTLQVEANSNVSGLMPIAGATVVGIFGLAINPGFARYVHWIGADGTTNIGSTTVAEGLNAAFLIPPANTYFVRFSPRQRYAAGTTDFSSCRVYASNAAWAGKTLAILGDSITEMTDVDAGKYLFAETSSATTQYRYNWPLYALPRMLPSRVRIFAKSGAHFSDAAGLTSNQKFSTQVTNVLADTAPDAIIIGLGTNDWGNSTNVGGAGTLGTAAAALAKDYGSLDPTISMDGMRKGLQLLRYYLPNATIFGLTPLQRGDFNPLTTYGGMSMAGWVEEIRTMYRAYGVEIIDQFAETGILFLFEQVPGSGQHLSDTIHPVTSGMGIQADLISPRYRQRMGGDA